VPGALAQATNTPARTAGQQGFGYSSISVWYRPVHAGASNHLVVQSTLVR